MQNAKIKTILIIAVIVAIAAGTTFCLQVSRPSQKIDNLTDLVPSGALICISGHDIDKAWDKLKATEIYSQFLNSPFLKDSLKLGALRDKTQHEWFSQEEILRILGKEALLGIFFRKMVLEEPEFDIILLSRISQASRTKESILRSLSRIKQNRLVTSQKYKGFKIYAIEETGSGDSLVYLILRDVVIASNSFEIIKQAIDLFRNGYKTSISQEMEFKRVKAKLSDGHIGWLYLDIKRLVELTKNLEETNYPGFNLGPLHSYFLELKFREGIAVKGWSYFDAGEIENTVLKPFLESINNTNLKTLEFTPLNVAMFSGGNSGDMRLLWPYIKTEIVDSLQRRKTENGEGFQPAHDFPAGFGAILGIDLEKDLLPYLGKEFAFSLAAFKEINIPLSVSKGQVRPLNLSLPEMFACIQVLDKDKIKLIMHNFWQRMNDSINKNFMLSSSNAENKEGKKEKNAPLPAYLEVNNYSGVDVYALKFLPEAALPLGVGADILSPAYCFLADYLVISSNVSLLKKVINTYQKKNLGLSDSVRFSQVKGSLEQEFSSLFYINLNEIIAPLSKMFNSFTMQETDDIKQEEYKRNLTKVLQVMEMLKHIKAIGITGVYKDNFYEFNIFMPVDGL